MKLLIIVAILVICVGGAVTVYQSPVFSITSVRVTGADRLTNSYLERAAAVPAGSTLLRVDIKAIAQRLSNDPWVASARVEREFPSTLVLIIEERTPAALVEIYPDPILTDTVQWLISTDGMWLGVADDPDSTSIVSLEEMEEYPRIVGIAFGIEPVYGKKNTDEGIKNALAIIAGFSPEMLGLLANISAPDRNQTSLLLINNVTVLFGAAEDIQAKETAIITLLNEYPDTLISINVRVADRPTRKLYPES